MASPSKTSPSKPEKWRTIPGYEGYYEVSDFGRVRSLARRVPRKDGRTMQVRERIMRPYPHPYGYPTVNLYGPGSLKHMGALVHRLVYTAFNGPIPDGLYVCHRDGSRDNNTPDNLYAGTPSDNQQDAIKDGFRDLKILLGTKNPKVTGEKNGQAKLTGEQVLAIRERRASGEKLQPIADDHGITFQLVSQIIKRKVWSHV